MQRHGGAASRAIHLRLGSSPAWSRRLFCPRFEWHDAKSLGDTELIIEHVPIVARCPNCGDRPVVAVDQICCTECGTPTPDIVSGRELEVVALEIE